MKIQPEYFIIMFTNNLQVGYNSHLKLTCKNEI